jgi:hypothetical protein
MGYSKHIVPTYFDAAYYHELFLRGRPDLNRRMVRVRVKGTGCKSAASPATEPNFYSYAVCKNDDPMIHATMKALPSPSPAASGSEPMADPPNAPGVFLSDAVSIQVVAAGRGCSGERQEDHLTFSVTSTSGIDCLRDSNGLKIPCHAPSMDHHVHMTDNAANRRTCKTALSNVVCSTSAIDGLPFSVETTLNTALQLRLTGLNNDPHPGHQGQRHLNHEVPSVHSKVSSSYGNCFVRPLAAPRMLPSLNDFEPFPPEKSALKCYSLKEPNSMCASVVSSSSGECTPLEKGGLFWPLSDQEMQDISCPDEFVPLNVSFQDQIRRLLQDPFHHTESGCTPDVFDGTRDWEFDPLIVQSEVL